MSIFLFNNPILLWSVNASLMNNAMVVNFFFEIMVNVFSTIISAQNLKFGLKLHLNYRMKIDEICANINLTILYACILGLEFVPINRYELA